MISNRKIGESLFEKISQHYADGTPLSSVPNDQRLTKSICDHINRLLNTRKGTVPHLKDYGLTDISEIYSSLPGSAAALQEEIINLITRYEPRVEKLRVELQPFDPYTFKLNFNIHGVVKGGHRIYLSTAVSSDGRVDVDALKKNMYG